MFSVQQCRSQRAFEWMCQLELILILSCPTWGHCENRDQSLKWLERVENEVWGESFPSSIVGRSSEEGFRQSPLTFHTTRIIAIILIIDHLDIHHSHHHCHYYHPIPCHRHNHPQHHRQHHLQHHRHHYEERDHSKYFLIFNMNNFKYFLDVWIRSSIWVISLWPLPPSLSNHSQKKNQLWNDL